MVDGLVGKAQGSLQSSTGGSVDRAFQHDQVFIFQPLFIDLVMCTPVSYILH